MKAGIASRVVATLGLCLTLNACSEKHTESNPDKMVITAERSMNSESLALAGEQLVNPFTFMLADSVFDMALDKDPTNKRAQFYKSFLKSFMTLKGALNRIRPFVQTYGDPQKYEWWLLQLPNSPTKDWLFDGPADLRTEEDLQALVTTYRNGVIEFRNFVKQNLDLNLTINLNPFVLQQELQAQATRNCVITQNNPEAGSYQVVCDYREILQRKINSADMIALSQLAAGEILYLTLYSAYSAEGIGKLSKVDPANQWPLAKKQAFLEGHSNFGKLRADHNLNSIVGLGADFVAAWKWVVNNQNIACPGGGPESERPRRGYVFEKGSCVDHNSTAIQQVMSVFEAVLQGPINGAIELPQQTYRSTLVDVFAVTRKPVQDLRQLFPASYNSCGKADSLRDNTLGGIFPNGDGRYVLDTRCDKTSSNVLPIVFR